mmetsp:Transcript_9218/g.14203  ORF Transcript_9218/g.14203 Transcript_9218/m.14203 type:complete len:335 (+) Transcript_9218:118-1122(+)|eukprot:CAMPEP_0201730000 /NCGR_PEP_ID=MMETSP0593-20130828/20755_1 /ASSEMBLY_ACC=CAM_ASM_000672 /TAXON_ID=267983 /ORGANISM="Skeletonema japonicum, Strain CCMP2506" /LENGTH=334 /DNA_ID=CAMNT_0048222449 /DNA_START=22 /DNA_END=1026 /DNA_ORIENTATION=-
MAKKKGGGNKNNNKTKGGNNNNSNNTEKKTKKRGGKSKSHRHYSTSLNDHNDNDDDTQFRNKLLNQGHLIHEMNSDGNCLFRSLSDQLYNDDGDDHGAVRSTICDYLERNKDEFQSFLLMNEDDEDIMNIDDYVDHMREHTTWGSDIEIVAASRTYKRGIKVFSTHYGVLRFVDREDENDDQFHYLDYSSDDLLLSYHGNDHYNSVHPIDGSNNRRQRQQSKEGRHYTTRPRKNVKSKRTTDFDDDDDDNKEKEKSKTKSTITTSKDTTKKKRAPPPKGSPCPCKSGLTYKKCCLAREKANKRLAKKMNMNQDGDKDDDEKKEDFIGEFKVLNI